MVSPVSAVEIRTDSSGLDASVVHSLAAYARASKFRRTCLQVMAWSLSNSEMAEVREAFMEPWMVGWGWLDGDGRGDGGYSYGHLSVISTYNPIYRMYNPIYNQL